MPHYDIHLFFDEIGVSLDDDQYRDAISLVDMYHVYLRQHQVSEWGLPLRCRLAISCSTVSTVRATRSLQGTVGEPTSYLLSKLS